MRQTKGPEKVKSMKKGIILVSGGLDSATVLAIARDLGFEPCALTFRYGQRHMAEIEAAASVCENAGVTHRVVLDIDLGVFGGSALTDTSIDVPKDRSNGDIGRGIPITYVPARNTVFLSYALAWAEVLGAKDIFIGVNAMDYSGYPDCRPEFIKAFQAMANLATKAGVEGAGALTIHTPLMELSKAGIITKGTALGVDYAETLSCYDPGPGGVHCGHCDACLLRKKGFIEAKIADPTRYDPRPR